MIDSIKVNTYLDDIERQLEDLAMMPVPDAAFFTQRKNFERTKAIKYTLLVVIEDVIHISTHLIAALGLGKPKVASDSIILLGKNDIIPDAFARKIVGMVNFRNKLAHEYLPNEFEADRLYASLDELDDFRRFSKYIVRYLNRGINVTLRGQVPPTP
jgi:uncharacterized protein YutE (UPF0331/DUF86 family)